ncbi:response regulator [Subtercola boreus]|uniref:DNA-binding response regulator n=1 Tax=Subtercola boreus TaxID=120213 RepID=A0A3E0WD62_9MICO|nr:response regulator transcription factor [Subtercola boreus]RFA22750.1 DNA-binding response regulator [Subtercola boreus]RFA23105.1 DNA-binding response regulator [Subtercola boreus]RFA28858.1 DNA-binding response regulator [Subtercola boreus]
MSSSIRVGLADDQPLFRAGIAMVVNSQHDLTVEWEASNGHEAVELVASTPVDVVLMDLEMPRMGGIEAITRVLAEPPGAGPRPRFIVLTTFDLDDRTFDAINAGASGFLLKSTDPEFLLAAIRTVHSGSAVLAPSATTNLIRRFAAPHTANRSQSLEALTPRELDLFDLIASGLSNAEIAASLHLSDTTVKTHVSRILGKLGLRDRVQLVIFAYENGLIGSD